jgi:hypothetical protein
MVDKVIHFRERGHGEAIGTTRSSVLDKNDCGDQLAASGVDVHVPGAPSHLCV